LPAISPRRLHARELLLVAVMMYAALRSVRHIPIFVLVAAPLLSAMIEACLQQSGEAGWLKRGLPLNRMKLALNVIILAGFLAFAGFRIRYVLRMQSQVEAREFPVAAAAFLLNARPPAPMMNHYNWGGYFIWKLYPEYKVFIDGRADVYGDKFLEEFASAYHIKGEYWRVPLDRWNIQTVALPPDAPLVTALESSPGWTKIFEEPQAVILTRAR
jgi:hypothetical protein